MRDYSLQLGSQVALGSDKLKCILALFSYDFFNTTRYTVLVLLSTCFIHLAFQIKCLFLLGCIVFLDLKKLFLCYSELVFEDSIYHLQSVLTFHSMLAKIFQVAFLNGKVEICRQLMRLVGHLISCRHM